MVLIRYLGRSGGHVKLMCFLLPSWVLDWNKRLQNCDDFYPIPGVLAWHVLKMPGKKSWERVEVTAKVGVFLARFTLTNNVQYLFLIISWTYSDKSDYKCSRF